MLTIVLLQNLINAYFFLEILRTVLRSIDPFFPFCYHAVYWGGSGLYCNQRTGPSWPAASCAGLVSGNDAKVIFFGDIFK